ncbi:MAG: hypothetical protein HGA27_00165 [Peptococcaceae bacterium]|nr:hypothetical protein [Peptococcaceae bacterium]
MHNAFYPIEKALTIIEEKIRTSFNKNKTIDSIAEFNYTMDDYLTSALVIYAAKIYGEVNERILSLAETMQYIFFAVSFHNSVTEDSLIKSNSSLDHNKNIQYSVLIGDFTYGKFFVNLCDSDMLCYLDYISKMICKINEESVIGLKNQANSPNNPVENPIKYSIVFSGCCLLGAIEAGAGLYQQKCLEAFGHALGMAMENGVSNEQRDYYYKLALINLDCLKSNSHRDELKNLVFCLKNKDSKNNKMVC